MIEINGMFIRRRDNGGLHQTTEPAMRPHFALVVLATLLAAPAWAGDPDAGRVLAEKWCTNCHMVAPTQETATAIGVPTFSSIARMPSTTETSLKVFFQSPHVRMPDLHLSLPEIDDLTSYILSLRDR